MKLGAVGSVATDVLSLVLVYEEPAGTVVAGGEWKSRETGLGFSTFPSAGSEGGGNVELPLLLREFQVAVESVGNLLLVFLGFHHQVISTACWLQANCGGTGDSILH